MTKETKEWYRRLKKIGKHVIALRTLPATDPTEDRKLKELDAIEQSVGFLEKLADADRLGPKAVKRG